MISDAYRAVWRWHFYAGFFVLPVLMLLALSGGAYLFKPEIEAAVYRPMMQVEPASDRRPAEHWLAAATTAYGGSPTALYVPERADRAVQISLRTRQGDRTVFVDPYTARATGAVDGEGVMGTVKRLHSLELLGRPFNVLVEIVAGWAIILVATGVFLWWPRPRDAAVAVPRLGDPARRPFWRDLHAVTGLYAGAVILFLAVTGMPWSAVWGDRVLNLMRESGLGRPPPPSADRAWLHARAHNVPTGVGWTLEGAVLPTPGSGVRQLSKVLASAEGRGLGRPYTVSIPEDPNLAFTVSRETERAQDARSLYVDGRTGAVIADLQWSQFGDGAKAFEWGIAVHQGLQYGWFNRLIMLFGCIAVWGLGVSGLVMWWKRRPARAAGLNPPPAPPARARAAVLGIVLPLAILYPLTGLSLCLALVADRLWRRFVARPLAGRS